jgi:hypothetical protein
MSTSYPELYASRFIVGADMSSGDIVVLHDVSVGLTKATTILEFANKLNDYFPRLNDDGELVGPVILPNYANNEEADIVTAYTLVIVNGELRLGDGETEGGVPISSFTRRYDRIVHELDVPESFTPVDDTFIHIDGYSGTQLPGQFIFDGVPAPKTGRRVRLLWYTGDEQKYLWELNPSNGRYFVLVDEVGANIGVEFVYTFSVEGNSSFAYLDMTCIHEEEDRWMVNSMINVTKVTEIGSD